MNAAVIACYRFIFRNSMARQIRPKEMHYSDAAGGGAQDSDVVGAVVRGVQGEDGLAVKG